MTSSMYYKFNSKSEVFNFIKKINDGEKIVPSLENTTESYCQPIPFMGEYYILKDEITSKYTDADEFDPFVPLDTTPPTLSEYAVIIPEVYQWAFPENKFVLGGFEIPLDTNGTDKVVNVAYFMWQEFRDELDSGNHTALKRALMPLWNYVSEQVTNQNLVVL